MATIAMIANRRRSSRGAMGWRCSKRCVSGQLPRAGGTPVTTTPARADTPAATRRDRGRQVAGQPTATPAPSPPARASTLNAYARLFRGISSAATTPISSASASPTGRPMVCVPTSTQKFGAMAPSAHHRGATHAVTTIICRRPRRSASIANGIAITTPSRTITPPTPWPRSSIPNPSAAKLAVCVNSVLANAAAIDAAASSPSVATFRCVSRSGGDHHGTASSACGRWRKVPRTGKANNHPNHGMSMR